MTGYVIDEEIQAQLKTALQNDRISAEEKLQLNEQISKGIITVNGLQLVCKFAGSNEVDLPVHTLIKGKKLVFEGFSQKTKPSISSELSQRREYLLNKMEEKDYNRMVYGSELNPAEQDIQSVSNQLSSVRNQISVGVNMIVAIFATFGICYYIGGQFTDNKATRMIYGLTGSVLVMMLEMVLFILRAVQMEHAYEQGTDKKANKKVNKNNSVSVSSDVSKDMSGTAEALETKGMKIKSI